MLQLRGHIYPACALAHERLYSLLFPIIAILIESEVLFVLFQLNVVGQLLGFIGSGLYAYYKLVGK